MARLRQIDKNDNLAIEPFEITKLRKAHVMTLLVASRTLV